MYIVANAAKQLQGGPVGCCVEPAALARLASLFFLISAYSIVSYHFAQFGMFSSRRGGDGGATTGEKRRSRGGGRDGGRSDGGDVAARSKQQYHRSSTRGDLLPHGFAGSEARRRAACREVGSSLSRKRLLQTIMGCARSGSSTRNGGNNGDGVVRPRLLYRRNPNDGDEEYQQVSLLDPRDDVVVGLTRGGKIDVVRVGKVSNDGVGGDEEELPRPLASSAASTDPSLPGGCASMRSVHGGCALAVGGKLGDMAVFDVEYEKIQHRAQGKPVDGPRPQANDIFKMHPLQRATLSHALIDPANGVVSTFFGPSAWQFPRPKRVMMRSSRYSLMHQIVSPSTVIADELREFPHWFEPGRLTRMNEDWDFYQSSPSTLLSVHASQVERDFFSLRVLDSRCDGKRRSHWAGQIAMVDRSMPMSASSIEYGVCYPRFLSSGTEIATPGYGPDRAGPWIKIWDVRFMRSRGAPKPVKEYFIPSFPTGSVYSAESVARINALQRPSGSVLIRAMDDGKLLCVLQYNGNNAVVSAIDPSKGDEPRTIATLKFSKKGLDVAYNCRTNVVAFAPFQGHAISLLDLSKGCNDRGGSDDEHRRRRQGNKRPRANSTTSNLSSPESSCYHSIPVEVLDRYGTSTALGCLAFSECGTSLVGGTYDGDLYLFRRD